MNVWRRGLVAAVCAVVLTGIPVADLSAKKPRTRFSAVVDGRRVKGLKRAIFFTLASTSFSLTGQSAPRRGVSRAITALCGPVDLRSLALPATLACYGSYVESRRSASKEWVRAAGIEVTVDAFDGTRAEGRFRGALDTTVAHPTDASVTIEDGAFAVFVRDVGV